MANNRYDDKKGRLEIKLTSIETVDQAVFDYFNKKLAITVNDNGGRKKVPVIYATGERWKLVRDNKEIRDENGTLILPLIAIIRTDIDREPAERLGGQEVKQITISSNVHVKNSNLQQRVFQRKKNGFPEPKRPPTREYLTIPFPDFANLHYQVKIWTQYTGEMNEVLERIFYAYDHMDSFVMPVEYENKKPKGKSHYFVGYREGNVTPESNSEDFTDQERIIRYTYSIKVPAYFVLDPKDEPLSYGKDDDGKHIYIKKQSANDISLKEQVLSHEEYEEMFDI